MENNLDALIDRVRDAAAQHTPLRIRGSGSKDFYGETLQGEVIDTRAYCGITSYEPSELVITVRAGTPLVELEAALAERGQCLAFEPPRFAPPNGLDGGTCGGMVAAGLSGPARASVGSLRDYVLGVQLINGRAEHLTFGGQVMKNVAGYDLSRLMVGAMGTLGLLTDISLKVLPVAPAEATLVFEMDQAHALWRLSMPQTAPALNLPWAQLVEWHGGQRWLWAPASAMTQLRQAVETAGGSASIFIATNAIKTRARGVFSPLKPAIEQIHRRLKAEFDPAGIFNPGRTYPNL
jgi:glycolate oxidase FAD binding subunit